MVLSDILQYPDMDTNLDDEENGTMIIQAKEQQNETFSLNQAAIQRVHRSFPPEVSAYLYLSRSDWEAYCGEYTHQGQASLDAVRCLQEFRRSRGRGYIPACVMIAIIRRGDRYLGERRCGDDLDCWTGICPAICTPGKTVRDRWEHLLIGVFLQVTKSFSKISGSLKRQPPHGSTFQRNC